MERHTYTIVLRRDQESVPWGFRLQGGTNFATPLTVQSVQPSSISATAGLVAGDGVLKINGKNADLMEHEEAKEEILKSGNEVTFYVQRAATITWSPRVPAAGPDQSATGNGNDAAVGISRISLAVSRPAAGTVQNVGSSFNRVPKPFGAAAAASPAAVSPPIEQSRSPLPLLVNSNSPYFSANNSRPPPVPPAVTIGAPPTKAGLTGPPMAPNNVVVNNFDDDPLPPPPPPLNGAFAVPSVAAPGNGGGADAVPLRGVVSAAAAAAAADRAARLANDRSASPSVSLAPVATGVGTVGGRTTPRSLSPSYHSKVSHIRSRSAELLQQYVDAADQESPSVDQQQVLQQQKSAVLLALEQEEEFKRRGAAADAGRRPSADAVEEEPQLYKGAAVKSRAFRLLEQEIERGSEVKSALSPPIAPLSSAPSPSVTSGFRSVAPPQTKLDNRAKDAVDNGQAPTDSGPLRCYSCGGLINGVFAKVRGRPIHSDCIRCSKCKLSLKTVGYFFVNDNMYCEQHAKEATRPAESGFVAYVVDAPGNSDY